jgi:2-polyprenyl-3-methyl-5-hydroxy-6-metoxy-1,4-benzoquinol methylase
VHLPIPAPDWPESWRLSYEYDRLELGDGTTGYTRAYQRRRGVTLDLVSRASPPGATILDVAAAQGNVSLILAELGYRVTWNDLRVELADYVRIKHEHGELKFMPGEILQIDPIQHDVVLATEIIEHVAHPDQFLLHLARFARPGGHVILTTPNGAYFRNPLPRFSDFADTSEFEAVQFKPHADGHIFLLHAPELRRLAERAGLDVIELRLFSTPLTAGWLGTERLVPWLPGGERLLDRLPGALRRRAAIHLGALLRRPSELSAE